MINHGDSIHALIIFHNLNQVLSNIESHGGPIRNISLNNYEIKGSKIKIKKHSLKKNEKEIKLHKIKLIIIRKHKLNTR